jgi:hypothetical protein
VLATCWARYRFTPSSYWGDIEDFENNDNSINENALLEKFLPVTYKVKKALHSGYHLNNEERRKKFLSDSSNLQGGHGLQGLWAMPGRR